MQNNFMTNNLHHNNEANVIEEVPESMDNINESSKFHNKLRSGEFLHT